MFNTGSMPHANQSMHDFHTQSPVFRIHRFGVSLDGKVCIIAVQAFRATMSGVCWDSGLVWHINHGSVFFLLRI